MEKKTELAVKGITGIVIPAKAMQGINMVLKGMQASAKFAEVSTIHQSAPQMVTQGLCICLANGVSCGTALRELSGRKGCENLLASMHDSDGSALRLLCEAIDENITVKVANDASVTIRSMMVGKHTIDKVTKVTKTTFPSLQGLAGKIRIARKVLLLENADGAAKQKLLAKIKADKVSDATKKAESAIRYFGSISGAVRNIALAVQCDDKAAELDRNKAKLLEYVSDLAPKAVNALLASLKISNGKK